MTAKIGAAFSAAVDYVKETRRQPLVRAAKDNKSYLGRSWQVAWIISLVVAGLCITGAVKDLGTTDYIKKLFEECKVFEASCYVALGLFIGYILFGSSNKLNQYVNNHDRPVHDEASSGAFTSAGGDKSILEPESAVA